MNNISTIIARRNALRNVLAKTTDQDEIRILTNEIEELDTIIAHNS
jgi:hypothetical protein